jgi:steroid 5-alpha reductase family enzyme
LLGTELVIGLAACHLICTIIFHHFIYVFNYGYAWIMIVTPLLYGFAYPPSVPSLVVLAIAFLYGLRLLSFTWRRYHSDSYAERAQRAVDTSKIIPFTVKIITWFFMGSLMFFISFNIWVVASSEPAGRSIWFAAATMLVGLLVESLADRQKQLFKRGNKSGLIQTGLYSRIRHPNYLGEIVFHLGLYWAMAATAGQGYPLILGGLGTGWVLILMCEEAIMLDRKKQKQFDDTESLADYRRKTGLLLPRLF